MNRPVPAARRRPAAVLPFLAPVALALLVVGSPADPAAEEGAGVRRVFRFRGDLLAPEPVVGAEGEPAAQPAAPEVFEIADRARAAMLLSAWDGLLASHGLAQGDVAPAVAAAHEALTLWSVAPAGSGEAPPRMGVERGTPAEALLVALELATVPPQFAAERPEAPVEVDPVAAVAAVLREGVVADATRALHGERVSAEMSILRPVVAESPAPAPPAPPAGDESSPPADGGPRLPDPARLAAALAAPLEDATVWEPMERLTKEVAPQEAEGRIGFVVLVDDRLTFHLASPDILDHLSAWWLRTRARAGAGASPGDDAAVVVALLEEELARTEPSTEVLRRLLERLEAPAASPEAAP